MNGKHVLLIDMDPQADLSACLGVDRTDELETTVTTMKAAAFYSIFDNIDKVDVAIYYHN